MRELEITVHRMRDKWEIGGRVGDPPEGDDKIKVEARSVQGAGAMMIPGPFKGYLLEASRLDNSNGSFRYVIESVGDVPMLYGFTRISKEVLQEIDQSRIPLEIDIPGSWNW